MKLNQIADNDGARKSRMRVGRGIGSGKGKTSGRGVKGQTSRTGVAIKGFEGGQTPIYRRLPKRGFKSLNPVEFSTINLSDLQKFVDAGKLDAKEKITSALLVERGFARQTKNGVKLLAKGELKAKLQLTVDAASKKAIELVEKAGGKVEVTEPKKAPKAAKAPKTTA